HPSLPSYASLVSGSPICLLVFPFYQSHRHHQHLHSFPTRRSSDLTRRQVAIQNRVASNIGISQSTFSVKVLNLFSRYCWRPCFRSEERFSRNAETDLVCRLLLEKKNSPCRR